MATETHYLNEIGRKRANSNTEGKNTLRLHDKSVTHECWSTHFSLDTSSSIRYTGINVNGEFIPFSTPTNNVKTLKKEITAAMEHVSIDNLIYFNDQSNLATPLLKVWIVSYHKVTSFSKQAAADLTPAWTTTASTLEMNEVTIEVDNGETLNMQIDGGSNIELVNTITINGASKVTTETDLASIVTNLIAQTSVQPMGLLYNVDYEASTPHVLVRVLWGDESKTVTLSVA